MPLPRKAQRNKTPLEIQLLWLSLGASLPLMLVLLWTLYSTGVSVWLLTLAAFLSTVLVAYSSSQIYKRSVYQFRSLSNLLEAMIQGDYSMRARTSQGDGALDQLSTSVNQLAHRLTLQRTQTVESQKLLETVIDYIDVAIVALDEQGQVRFTNAASSALFGIKTEQQRQALVDQLQFAKELLAGQQQVAQLNIGKKQGKFKIHVERFRESGRPHLLLFITDVQAMLRNEQNQAWQSLVRVISHEINNSLSPIASISATLNKRVGQTDIEPGLAGDLAQGLGIIAQRAKNLGQFVQSYQQLAKLPAPAKQEVDMQGLLTDTSALFPNDKININAPGALPVTIDKGQIQQVLINLIKNALEAMEHLPQEQRQVQIALYSQQGTVSINISDQGKGIANPDNLFVPFYTTKKQGSGIGLLLSRQIIEAHGGSLRLQNNAGQGCTAHIELTL